MKLLAIDGNSIMNRAFYGIKQLSTRDGIFTNALTGFMNIYFKAAGETSPDACAVAFDVKEPTFRHKACDSYKANRHGMPDELAMQMPYIKQILAAMGITVLECPGYEADDILGTLASICGEDDRCYILTGDRDSLQLVRPNVTVLLHTTREMLKFTPEKFTEVYEGLVPLQLIDLKGLMGDASDNISGVRGIGEKTAMGLLKNFGSVEKIYEALDKGGTVGTKAVETKLAAGRDDAKQSKFLATIVSDAPISRDISSYTYGERRREELAQVLSRLEMYKLLDKLKIKPAPVVSAEPRAEAPRIEYTVSDTPPSDGFAFVLRDGTLYTASDASLYSTSDEKTILSLLSSDVPKKTFGAKDAYRYCFDRGCKLKNVVSDAMIAGYLLDANAGEYTIEGLCARFGVQSDGEYGADALNALCTVMENELERQSQTELYRQVELPLTEVLASMEYYGVAVDSDGIKEFGQGLQKDIGDIQNRIYFRAGRPFNIASTKQLGEVLFNDLGLPSGKKTKTGYSTSAEVLEELIDRDPIISDILMYRQYTKLMSTYVDGLLKQVSEDGRIHTSFNQTETRTGRISSAEPNLQNIPVRTELGRNMRKFFVAGGGKKLVDADYSQIELRILAHLSHDKNMQAAFSEGKDIHTATAAQVFGMPEEMVSPEMRRAAKAVNFGIVYGIGAFSLSKDIDVSVAQADRYIKNYLANFSGVRDFMKQSVDDATEKGYSKTLFGRRRYIPELSAKNKNIQAFGKRVAMNAPVQGTAADVIKIAMVRVYKRLEEEGIDARLVLQIHDELIIESAEECAQRAARILAEEMPGAADLEVPLTADVSIGMSWAECH